MVALAFLLQSSTVVEVRTVSDRVIVLKVLLEKIVPNVISAYAPQAGRTNEEEGRIMGVC